MKLFLVATKADIAPDGPDRAVDYVDHLSIPYFRTSSLPGLGVDELFQTIANIANIPDFSLGSTTSLLESAVPGDLPRRGDCC
jgi:hypothetical protein